jgi:hypothetical protein
VQDFESKYGGGGGDEGQGGGGDAGGGPPRVTSPAEYAALPSGTVYIDPNGRRRTKR